MWFARKLNQRESISKRIQRLGNCITENTIDYAEPKQRREENESK